MRRVSWAPAISDASRRKPRRSSPKHWQAPHGSDQHHYRCLGDFSLCRPIINVAAPASMPLTPGARLGSYEVTAHIGVGGMGEVYRATDTVLKRQVALKVL